MEEALDGVATTTKVVFVALACSVEPVVGFGFSVVAKLVKQRALVVLIGCWNYRHLPKLQVPSWS